MNFEKFLCNKNDDIDNAAHYLLYVLSSDGEVEWDMEMIGDLVGCAEKILQEHSIAPCHPFWEGEKRTPCYLGEDCERKECLFRKARRIK